LCLRPAQVHHGGVDKRAARPPEAAADGEGTTLPPSWVVMAVALVGLAIGPAILTVGAVDEVRNLLESSGAFVLWAALVATQSMLWTLASGPLVGAFVRHWRATGIDATARRDVVLAALMLAILVAAVPFTSFVVGRPEEVIPHAHVKTYLLTAITFVVALGAAGSIWLIRARLERLGTDATKENLRTYLALRSELDRHLAYLGGVVGLAVLSSAVLRSVLAETNTAYPPEAVILYGIALSLIVALVFVPTYLAAQAVGGKIRDGIAPLPDRGPFADGLAERRKLEDVLGLTVSASASFRAAVAIFAPLLGSLTSLVPNLGG
jgi:hypothetical protein